MQKEVVMTWLVIVIFLVTAFFISAGLKDNEQEKKPTNQKNKTQIKPKAPKKSGHKERYNRLYGFCNQDNIVFFRY